MATRWFIVFLMVLLLVPLASIALILRSESTVLDALEWAVDNLTDYDLELVLDGSTATLLVGDVEQVLVGDLGRRAGRDGRNGQGGQRGRGAAVFAQEAVEGRNAHPAGTQQAEPRQHFIFRGGWEWGVSGRMGIPGHRGLAYLQDHG